MKLSPEAKRYLEWYENQHKYTLSIMQYEDWRTPSEKLESAEFKVGE